MWVEIIVSRAAYPNVGDQIDIVDSIANQLVKDGLAKFIDKKTEKKNTTKPKIKPETE